MNTKNEKTYIDLNQKIDDLNLLLDQIENDKSKIDSIYKSFKSSNSIINYKDVTKEYLERCPKLADAINNLIKGDLNPFQSWNLGKHRIYGKYKMDDRGTEVANDKDIKETMIQRYLMKSEHYEDKIGKMIGYEVTIPGKFARKYPIDLISYKSYKIEDSNNIDIYLIELKKCKVNSSGEDSKEIILRAVSEIATYYQVFKSALMCEEDGLAQEIVDRINKKGDTVTVNDVRNAKIYKVIIGPEDMIKTKSLLLEKGINLETYKFMTIKSNSSCFEFSVNQKEKLFNIEEVEL